MSEMIERVARAICKDEGFDPDVNDFWQDYESNARAAITAMREPTGAMQRAGHDSVHSYDEFVLSPSYMLPAERAWQAMIDAALN